MTYLRNYFLGLGLLAGLLLIGSAHAESSCSLVDNSLKVAVRIRGLRLKQRVPCVMQNQAEVKAFILKSIEEQLTPEQISSDSIIYKALGLIPEDWEYKNQLVELYLSQIGGYYDPEAKRYAMAAWLPDMVQESIAIHELTHALQDQHYNLKALHQEKTASTDQQLARSALIEGDATAVMLDHTRSLLNQGPISSLADVESLVMQQTLSMALSPTIRDAPAAISYAIMFPYVSGLRFAHHLLRHGEYKRVDLAYKQLPSSTEEILHPQKYLKSVGEYSIPSDNDLLEHAQLTNASIKTSDTFGEFMISMLLGTGNNRTTAAQAAAGWAGDKVAIVENGSQSSVILLTYWDTTKDTQEFLEAAQAFVQTRRQKQLPNSPFEAPTLRKLDRQTVLLELKFNRQRVP